MIRYKEQEQLVSQSPIDLAGRLVRSALGGSFAVYERLGEWSIGIGTIAEICVYADRVEVSAAGNTNSTRLTSLSASIQAAIASLQMEGYRLYGTADFELSRCLYGLPVPADAPLLHLFAPLVEIRLRGKRALLRSAMDDEITKWSRRLHDIDGSAPDVSPQLASAARLEVNTSEAGASDFQEGVASAVQQINLRAFDKVVLSRIVPINEPIDIIASYQAGRDHNQPVRSFLLRRGDFLSAGFCPETLVEADEAGRVSTQCLAGTRAVPDCAVESDRLGDELLSDPKEVAEHALSVRMAVEELKTVCVPDEVKVGEFMQLCRRGGVQHLGSKVHGHLAEERTAWDAFQALFPAVTASGVPKREAIEAIGSYETKPRGLYGGCVMIFDSDGSLDAALVLRSAFQINGETWLQAGAGIVSLSHPPRELQETCEKLSGVSRSLVRTPPEHYQQEHMQGAGPQLAVMG